MRIGLAIGTDDLLRAAPPRRGDGRFAGVAVRAGNIESEIGGPKIVALGLVGLECALLHLQLNVGVGGEERGECERLEVHGRKLDLAIGLR